MKYHLNPETHVDRIWLSLGSHALDLLNFVPGSRIIDWGCSVGITSLELSKLFPDCKIYGVEINKETPDREIFDVQNVELLIADGYNLPLIAKSMDGVFMMQNILYLLNYLNIDQLDLNSMLYSVANVLKEEGFLIMCAFDFFPNSRFYIYQVKNNAFELIGNHNGLNFPLHNEIGSRIAKVLNNIRT